MKGILFGLLLGISAVTFAQVVPDAARPLKRANLTTPDLSKLKVIVDLEDVVTPEYVPDSTMGSMKEMGVLTKENVQSINTMARLMRDNPDGFAQQVLSISPDDEVYWPGDGVKKLGSTKDAESAVVAEESDDPVEMLSNIRMPELTGTYEEMEVNRAVMKAEYEKAMKQISELSRKHLGQKSVSTFTK
ncbi:MAG: hypothetical protein II942_01835 [Alphaproteobacteria bacterium]|nr:hypothetical protein [Alphaproteobacteria bacterium]